jgi:hypothetical protein
MFQQFCAGEGKEIVPREVGFGRFSEILHGVGHGLSLFESVGSVVTKRSLDTVEPAALFGPSVDGSDFGVVTTDRQYPKMVGMGQLMQGRWACDASRLRTRAVV